ncbi:hypothetical protein CLU84_0775 [Comamonas sp. 26]|nr:hypothetical protein CLU84_0775 [Comamonas sp. 26]
MLHCTKKQALNLKLAGIYGKSLGWFALNLHLSEPESAYTFCLQTGRSGASKLLPRERGLFFCSERPQW